MAADGRELLNRTIVVTRDESADGPLSRKLKRRGARVLLWPTVRFSPPEDPGPLQAALQDLESYDWLVFTSARAVDAVMTVVKQLQEKVRLRSARPATARVVAVGAGTSQALRSAGWPVDLEPDEASSDAVLRALGRNPIAGTRVLFPASSLAGRILGQGLRDLGAKVDEVVAYRAESVPLSTETARRIQSMVADEGTDRTPDAAVDDTADDLVDDAADAALNGAADDLVDDAPNDPADAAVSSPVCRSPSDPIDAVCFASPSAILAWSNILGAEQFTTFGRRVLVAAIGKTTETALHRVGCENVVVAREGTFSSLADVVAEEFSRPNRT